MKKYFLILSFVSLLVSSCEKDDFCIDPITPNMIIRFYDATNPTETKSVSNLSVQPEGYEDIYSNVSIDSLLLPLDVMSNEIVYNLSSDGNQDILTITYDVEEKFVSRSCGFKAIFRNVIVTSDPSNEWILGLTESGNNTVTISTIEDESAAHVQIYH